MATQRFKERVEAALENKDLQLALDRVETSSKAVRNRSFRGIDFVAVDGSGGWTLLIKGKDSDAL